MPNLSSSSIQAYIGLPYDSVNWIGLFVFSGFLAWLIRRSWDLKWRMPWQKWALLVLLASSTFLVGRLLVIHPNVAYFLPLPGVPVETAGLVIYLLACLPFLLGSGFLGV